MAKKVKNIKGRVKQEKKRRKFGFWWWFTGLSATLGLGITVAFNSGFVSVNELSSFIGNFNSSSEVLSSTQGSSGSNAVVRELKEISVARVPYKTTYSSFESINVAGGQLLLTYNDGTSIVIDMLPEMLQSPDLSRLSLGKNNVTINFTYQGLVFSTNLEITINDLFVKPQVINVLNIASEIEVGSNGKINLTFQPTNINYNKILITSSNPEILEIDNQGNYVTKGEGLVQITIEVDGVTKIIEIEVTPKNEVPVTYLREVLTQLTSKFEALNPSNFSLNAYNIFNNSYNNIINNILNSKSISEVENLIQQYEQIEQQLRFAPTYTTPPILDTTAPVISNLLISPANITPFGANLSWTPANDQSSLLYYIYIDSSPINDFEDLLSATLLNPNGTSNSSFSVSGLNPNTTYNIVVLVKDSFNNQSLYSNLSFTTIVPTITVGSLSGGPIVAGVSNNAASYTITTEYIDDNTPVTITWYTTIGATIATSAPAGITITGSNVLNNSSTLSLTVNAAAPTVAGNYYYKVNIGGYQSSVTTFSILSKTVNVGTIANGPIVAATAISGVTYPVTTQYIDDSSAVSVTWYTTVGATITTTAPAGISIAGDPVLSNTTTLNVTVNAAAPTVAGNYFFRITIDGIQSNVVTLTILGKSVTVNGLVGGPIVAGVANNSATYPVTTQFIADGETTTVIWYTNSVDNVIGTAPNGITMTGSNVSSNALTLNVSVDESITVAGNYFFKIQVDNTLSQLVTFSILTKTVTVQSIVGGPIVATNAITGVTYPVVTQYISDNAAVSVNWYTTVGATIITTAPAGITITGSNVLNNAATLTVTVDETAPTVAGSYFFKIMIDSTESNVVTLTVVSKTISLASMTGDLIVEGQANTTAVYVVSTQYIADETVVSVTWYTDSNGDTVGTAPSGITIDNKTITAGSANLTVTVDSGTIVQGTYYFKVSAGGVTSILRPLVIYGKTVTIGDLQNGIIRLGQSSSNRKYAVTTQYISNGAAATITWYTLESGGSTTTSPNGVTITPNGTISNNSLELNVVVDGTLNQTGTYYFTATISGVESARKALEIVEFVNTSTFESSSQETIILITSTEDLNKIRGHTSNTVISFGGIPYFFDIPNKALYAHYKLANNIAFSLVEPQSWEPIGNGLTLFSGTFDGNGYSISNLYINLTGVNTNTIDIGLFGKTSFANLINISLLNINYDVSNYSSFYSTGGLVGEAVNTLITNSVITGIINAQREAGGLVGYSSSSTIYRNKAEVNITSSGSITGGLVGWSASSIISQNFVNATIDAKDYVGGIIGEVRQPGSGVKTTIINNYSTGAVTGTDLVGGIVGYATEFGTNEITNNYSVATVNLKDNQSPPNLTLVYNLIGSNQFTFMNDLVFNSYFISDQSDIDSSDDIKFGKAATSAELKAQGNYTNWDFANVWQFSAGVNNDYPILRWSNNITPISSTNLPQGNQILLLDVNNPASYTFAGLDWYDLSIYSRKFTIANTIFGPSFVDAVDRDNLLFDGVDDYIDLGKTNQIGNISSSNGFAIEMWIKIGDKTKDMTIIQNGTSYENSTYFIRQKDGALEFGINSSSATRIVSISNSNYEEDTWYHIVGVYTRLTNIRLHLNRDTSPINQINNTSPLSEVKNGDANTIIGGTSGLFFDGSLGYLRIHDKTLTASAVATLYNQTK